MIRAKYKGEFYKALIYEDNIEIIFQGPKEGFQRRWKGKEIVSYKYVEKSELEDIYDIDFYAVWNDERFDIWSQEEKSVCLWKFCGNSEYADKYGFHVTSKCEYVKEVQIEECDYFIMSFSDYYDVKKPAEEIKLTKQEFVDTYRKFVDEM